MFKVFIFISKTIWSEKKKGLESGGGGGGGGGGVQDVFLWFVYNWTLFILIRTKKKQKTSNFSSPLTAIWPVICDHQIKIPHNDYMIM